MSDPDHKIFNAKAAELYRRNQAKELLLQFSEANGRPPQHLGRA